MPSQPNAAAPTPSEAKVFEAASRFYAALLGAGRVNETNQPGIMRYCIRAAIQLVQETSRTLAEEREPVRQTPTDDLDLEVELEELAKAEGTAYRARPTQGSGGRQGSPPGSL
jgi:hypothetical protein